MPALAILGLVSISKRTQKQPLSGREEAAVPRQRRALFRQIQNVHNRPHVDAAPGQLGERRADVHLAERDADQLRGVHALGGGQRRQIGEPTHAQGLGEAPQTVLDRAEVDRAHLRGETGSVAVVHAPGGLVEAQEVGVVVRPQVVGVHGQLAADAADGACVRQVRTASTINQYTQLLISIP